MAAGTGGVMTSYICDSEVSWTVPLLRVDIEIPLKGSTLAMYAARNVLATSRTCIRGITSRSFASRTEGEDRITQALKVKFPKALNVRVVDISGGCGAMYEIHIESEEFKDKRTVQQHKMVNEALQEEIKAMHGLRIFTTAPKP
ncbi:bolA-like protein 3 [Xenopus laevis]|uniref:BolA-like protein 3 n=2 Tax=Xenopus laevis TaxID=8355 RepID=A0A1L8GS60_XENLA|nr:bolA-like protein 3 [Xenopus laevis]OCT86687.1 hypothetical protein XELAEV_18020375mg [Xenopus laevis]